MEERALWGRLTWSTQRSRQKFRRDWCNGNRGKRVSRKENVIDTLNKVRVQKVLLDLDKHYWGQFLCVRDRNQVFMISVRMGAGWESRNNQCRLPLLELWLWRKGEKGWKKEKILYLRWERPALSSSFCKVKGKKLLILYITKFANSQ